MGEFSQLQKAHSGSRFFFLSSKVARPYWDMTFREGDFLVFGRESKGLPATLLAKHRESALTIPMTEGTRSLNLATSAGIVLYEAVRQTGLPRVIGGVDGKDGA